MLARHKCELTTGISVPNGRTSTISDSIRECVGAREFASAMTGQMALMYSALFFDNSAPDSDGRIKAPTWGLPSPKTIHSCTKGELPRFR